MSTAFKWHTLQLFEMLFLTTFTVTTCMHHLVQGADLFISNMRYTVGNVKTKPALFRATTPSKENLLMVSRKSTIYIYFYYFSYSPHHAKLQTPIVSFNIVASGSFLCCNGAFLSPFLGIPHES